MCKNKFKSISLLLITILTACLSSCSGDEYLNVIPADSKALVAIDAAKITEQTSGKKNSVLLKAMFHVSDISDCGIDITSKIYIFESTDGNVGMVAKVKDEDNLNKWLTKLAKYGMCKKLQERRGNNFTVVKDSWVVGFNDNALLAMGPVISSAQPEMMRRMIKYLDADEGIKGTPIFDKIDTYSSSVAWVAQSDALPEQFATPLLLGVPKGVSPSQVMFAAEMNISQNSIRIEGETFSFDEQADKALKEADKTFRPISGKFTKRMPEDTAIGFVTNTDGTKFIDVLHANKDLLALLAGINTAIDMDNIIRSIDGDMVISLKNYGSDHPKMQMFAELGNRDFLKDIGYWKQSCPAGTRIEDAGKDAYRLIGHDMSFNFGVTTDNIFYAGNVDDMTATGKTEGSDSQLAAAFDSVKGKRMAIIIHIPSLFGGSSEAKIAGEMLKPVLGKAETIVFTL